MGGAIISESGGGIIPLRGATSFRNWGAASSEISRLVDRGCVAGRWIGRRDRLRLDRRRPAEGRVIENRKIFGDRAA